MAKKQTAGRDKLGALASKFQRKITKVLNFLLIFERIYI